MARVPVGGDLFLHPPSPGDPKPEQCPPILCHRGALARAGPSTCQISRTQGPFSRAQARGGTSGGITAPLPHQGTVSTAPMVTGSANPWAWGSLGTAAGLGWSASVPWSSAQPLSAPLPSLRQEGRDPPVTHAQKTQDPKFQTGLLGGVRHLAGTMLPPNPAGTRSLCWKPQASPAPELHGSPSKGHSPAFPAASPLDRDQGQIPAGVCRVLGEPKGMSPEEGAGGEEGVLHASESTSPSSKENGRIL